jgi:hypothetical protein
LSSGDGRIGANARFTNDISSPSSSFAAAEIESGITIAFSPVVKARAMTMFFTLFFVVGGSQSTAAGARL